MNRREFIKRSLLATLATLTSGFPKLSFAHSGSDTILVNLFLGGGPDFRHVFVPPFDGTANTYGNAFWRARSSTHDISPNDSSRLHERWNQYFHVSDNGQQFGIHPHCGWLKQQFDQGNVAIINNVFGSQNRNHSHSTIMMERGDMNSGSSDSNKDGWGGRLAKACDAKVASLTNSVRQFCYGPHPANQADHDNGIIIDAADTRNIGLYEYQTDTSSHDWKYDVRGYMSRALQSYYAAKRKQIGTNSPYYPLIQHETSMRSYMKVINSRLEQFPVPEIIGNLYDNNSENRLNNHNFGQQIQNVYDVIACEDVMNTNILSMEYGNWDHHGDMRSSIEPKIGDIFGYGRGLSALYSALNENQPRTTARIIFLIYGEFGLQLAANGDSGTDHGVGNTVLVIGHDVNGGVYGNMFPNEEIARFNESGSDISGKTSILRVFGQICEKVKSGSGDQVIPNWGNAEIEAGVNLDTLFST